MNMSDAAPAPAQESEQVDAVAPAPAPESAAPVPAPESAAPVPVNESAAPVPAPAQAPVPVNELVETPAQAPAQAPVPVNELVDAPAQAPAQASVPVNELVDAPAQASVQAPESAAPVRVNELVDTPAQAPQLVAAAPAPQLAAAEAVLPEDAVSPMARLQQEMSSMNLFEGKTQEQIIGIRAQVETGLQAFNAIQNACQIMHDAIVATAEIKANGVRFNPEIGRLSDFVDHCKLLISINNANAEVISATVAAILETLKGLSEDSRFQNSSYKLSVNQDKIGDIGTQISLVLRIGEVFNVPVFTVYIMHDVFDNTHLNSEQAPQVVASPLTHNLKTIATCSRVDLMLELLLHATKSDPYDDVNVLIAHSINELIVSKFGKDSNPNDVIAAERAQFFGLIIANNEHVKSLITKSLLIAIIQNPSIMTSNGKRFSDMFPSGQYVKYFGEVAYRASFKDQGPIMMPGVQADPAQAPEPLTRTDIIVAALTAANAATGANANVVAAGGAAVSYYIKDFVNGMNANEFGEVIPESGLDVNALEALKRGCDNIPMNDIDCFVFGEVSRQFLLLFSLYMMILYANFYERPKRYGVIHDQVTSIQFNLSPESSDNKDTIELFMYGNHNNDANTKLISKRLKKNPNVQLVTQEIMCFSQLVNPICGEKCTDDGYYMQPIDLVKKGIDDFVVLYESLYPEGLDKPDLKALLESQYSKGVDNMVGMKTTMLDLICIFCNEDKALFIRIFMARKNPKDFARLRVFVEIYLLQLLRKKDAAFLEHKDALIGEIKTLRTMMQSLNDDYYLEQGNIAAVQAETATQLNKDRTDFLQLLRSIGRKIVLIPDPLDNAIPATFRKETGMRTMQFFKDPQNAQQIKYPFDMNQHMRNLYDTYTRVPAIDQTYDAWISSVFKEIPFTPKSEAFFREKLGMISREPQDGLLFTIEFDKMPVRSPFMLQLLQLLNGIKIDKIELDKMNKFKLMRSNLLRPLREFTASQGGVTPKATYVTKMYKNTPVVLERILPTFLKDVLLKEQLQNADPGLIETIDSSDYDDAVNEAIGRIILEWNAAAPPSLGGGGGGSTQKRKRVGKLNATTRTRSKMRLTNAKKSRKSRKKCRANELRFNRSRRA